MATSTTKKTTRTKTSVPAGADVEAKAVHEVEEKPVKIVPKDVDIHEYIPVLNGTRGRLIYISPKTQERFVWEEFGEEQFMELQELRNAKGANKKFYERNWFMFPDEYQWVIDYLGVGAFYKNALPVENFDDIFSKPATEVTKIVKALSAGQKKAVNYRARQLIAEGKIDSLKVIDALEKVLDVELIER